MVGSSVVASIRLIVGMAAALAASCTSSSAPDGAATPSGDGLLPVAWTSTLIPVEPPKRAVGGFVFHAVSPQRRFEAVSVAAADGRVRWRAPASPSRVDHGVGLNLNTLGGGRIVLWMRPGRVYQTGDVSLVAADAVTGQLRWSYGSGRLRVRSAPRVCRHGAAVCLIAYRAGWEYPRAVVLDAVSGRIVSDRDAPFRGDVRRLATDLYAAGDQLAGVDDQGGLRWFRTAVKTFGGQKVTSDYGWHIHHGDGRYVGSLGRVRSDGAATIDLAAIAGTAGFDAATGRTLWTRPRAHVFCGLLDFDLDHPVLCSYTGTANADATAFSDLAVTVSGIDPATGSDRWRASLGAVQGLVKGGGDVIRTADTSYTVRTAEGLTRLDLDRGPQPGTALDTGWCTADADVSPAQNVSGVNRGDPTTYSAERWYPCRIGDGGTTALDRPAAPADFLHSTDGVLAYTTQDGALRAVRTG